MSVPTISKEKRTMMRTYSQQDENLTEWNSNGREVTQDGWKVGPRSRQDKPAGVNTPHEEKPDVLGAPISNAFSGELLGDSAENHSLRQDASIRKDEGASATRARQSGVHTFSVSSAMCSGSPAEDTHAQFGVMGAHEPHKLEDGKFNSSNCDHTCPRSEGEWASGSITTVNSSPSFHAQVRERSNASQSCVFCEITSTHLIPAVMIPRENPSPIQ